MRHILIFGFATSLIAATVLVNATRAADEKPKYTIKEAMAAHKKGSIRDKVLDGSASKEEKEKLVALYKAMYQADPPKGDKENWKKLTKEMVDAAEEIVAGKAEGIDHLKKASNCGACHKEHKPS